MKAQRTIVVSALLAVLTATILLLPALPSFRGPPAFVERRGQRQKVLERIQSAGGWTAIQKDCDTLVEQYRESAFIWDWAATNALPSALAALKPQEVRFYSLRILRDFKDEPQVAVVRIKIFGLASTGGHATPYFGLEVVSGAGAEPYRPRPSRGGAPGNAYRSYSPVTDRIYEIY
jgi:hypothetical protein